MLKMRPKIPCEQVQTSFPHMKSPGGHGCLGKVKRLQEAQVHGLYLRFGNAKSELVNKGASRYVWDIKGCGQVFGTPDPIRSMDRALIEP